MMRCQQESSISDGNKASYSINAERPEEVSVLSPTSDLLKSGNASPLLKNHPSFGNYITYSETTQDDSHHSEFAFISAGTSQGEDCNCHLTLKKASTMVKSTAGIKSNVPTLVASQESAEHKVDMELMKGKRIRANSGPSYNRSKTMSVASSKYKRARVMKYVQDFSNCFENETILDETVEDYSEVVYMKAEHALDGLTYILKKQKIWIEFDQDIQDHPAYQQILDVKDSSLPLNIRYINSWVELDQNTCCPCTDFDESGLYVHLVIQMRYIGDHHQLAMDLIVFNTPKQDIDEDTVEDQADDALDEAKELAINGTEYSQAIEQSFNKIGMKTMSTPLNLEQIVWNYCFKDSLSKTIKI